MSRKKIPDELDLRIRAEARHRCGYCLSQQRFIPWRLEIEHIIPLARGGDDSEENLWLCCRSCNYFKGIQVYAYDPITNRRAPLYNPRRQKWTRHFKWSTDGTHVIGLTVSGRATVSALQLNNIFAVTARGEWVEVGWHPPEN